MHQEYSHQGEEHLQFSVSISSNLINLSNSLAAPVFGQMQQHVSGPSGNPSDTPQTTAETKHDTTKVATGSTRQHQTYSGTEETGQSQEGTSLYSSITSIQLAHGTALQSHHMAQAILMTKYLALKSSVPGVSSVAGNTDGGKYFLMSDAKWEDSDTSSIMREVRNVHKSLEDTSKRVADEQKITMYVAGGLTATLTASFSSYFLRAGSLLSSLMATMPLWKNFDPLTVFVRSKKVNVNVAGTEESETLTKEYPESDRHVEEMFEEHEDRQ